MTNRPSCEYKLRKNEKGMADSRALVASELFHTNSNAAPQVPHSEAPSGSLAPHSGQRSLRMAPHAQVSSFTPIIRSQTGHTRGLNWWNGSPQRVHDVSLSRTKKPQEGHGKVPPSATKIAPHDVQLVAFCESPPPQTGHRASGRVAGDASTIPVGTTGCT